MRSFKTLCWKCIVFVQKLLREHLCLTFIMFPGVYQEVCSLRNWLPDALDASIFTKSVKLSSKKHPEVLCLTWRLDVFLPIPQGIPGWAQGGHKVGTRPAGAQVPVWQRQEVHDTLQLPTFQRPGTGNWEWRGFLKSSLAISSIKSGGWGPKKMLFSLIVKGNWWGVFDEELDWEGCFWCQLIYL